MAWLLSDNLGLSISNTKRKAVILAALVAVNTMATTNVLVHRSVLFLCSDPTCSRAFTIRMRSLQGLVAIAMSWAMMMLRDFLPPNTSTRNRPHPSSLHLLLSHRSPLLQARSNPTHHPCPTTIRTLKISTTVLPIIKVTLHPLSSTLHPLRQPCSSTNTNHQSRMTA